MSSFANGEAIDGETEGLPHPDAATAGDVAEEHTREAIENVTITGLLTARAGVELVTDGSTRAARVSEAA